MARCCNDFTRTDALRRAVAEAGRGLPSIEPGMPVPAGTGLTRRGFVARTAGLALAVYGGGALLPRALEDGIAAAGAAGPQRVLVSVFLDGGADSLSMLYPAGDPLYRQLRPRLALAGVGRARVLRGRAPALAPLARARSPSSTGKARSPSSPASATPGPTSRTSPRATTGRSERRARA